MHTKDVRFSLLRSILRQSAHDGAVVETQHSRDVDSLDSVVTMGEAGQKLDKNGDPLRGGAKAATRGQCVLLEIAKLQQSTELCIKRKSFKRLCDEILRGTHLVGCVRSSGFCPDCKVDHFTADAVDVLHEEAEKVLVQWFADAELICIKSGLVTLQLDHLQTARRFGVDDATGVETNGNHGDIKLNLVPAPKRRRCK